MLLQVLYRYNPAAGGRNSSGRWARRPLGAALR